MTSLSMFIKLLSRREVRYGLPTSQIRLPQDLLAWSFDHFLKLRDLLKITWSVSVKFIFSELVLHGLSILLSTFFSCSPPWSAGRSSERGSYQCFRMSLTLYETVLLSCRKQAIYLLLLVESAVGFYMMRIFPTSNYMFKINIRHARTNCEICSKSAIKIKERRQLRRSGVFIVNFKHILHFILVFLLLTLSR